MQDVIRMTYDVASCHPDEITKIISLSHPDDLAIPSNSSGWLIVDALCHPDDLPGVGNSSGWVTANSLCHPDDILFHFMLSGWLNGGWFLIRMSYGNVIMSSGWDALPFVSHPDEMANFDFPQHAVALQRFRTRVPTRSVDTEKPLRITASSGNPKTTQGCLFKGISFYENQCVLIWFKFSKGPTNNTLALVPMVTYRRQRTGWCNASSPVWGHATWWRHQKEHFPRYWSFVRGIHCSPVESLHKGQ